MGSRKKPVRSEDTEPREARLRPEFAGLYPYITPGAWASANNSPTR
ncbi:MAG TPA: hypothetical protein VH764_08675 [Gemmatimonadales bacterium]